MSTSASARVWDGSRARSKRLSSNATSGIDRRELVDHEDVAAGERDAGELRDDELGRATWWKVRTQAVRSKDPRPPAAV